MQLLKKSLVRSLSANNKLFISTLFLLLSCLQNCLATPDAVEKLVESGWFGTARKADGNFDVAIDPDGELAVAIRSVVQSALGDRADDSIAFVPEDYKQNISFDLGSDGKFSIFVRRSDAKFRLESQLSEFINFLFYLGSYDSHTKIRNDFKAMVATEAQAVESLLNLDFAAIKSSREFYRQHWVPWCRENNVLPNDSLWGGEQSGESFEEFLSSDYAKHRAGLWIERIRTPSDPGPSAGREPRG